jgi:hypothetical protein
MHPDQARSIALALPEAIESPHFHMASFRVRGKIFATLPPEGDVLHIFLGEEDREVALALAPDFVEKLFWGERVSGVRVVLAKATVKTATELLRKAWLRKAPKSLAMAHSKSKSA